MWRKIVTLGLLAGLVATGSAAGRIHTVKRGDTLEGIGRQPRPQDDAVGQRIAGGDAEREWIVAEDGPASRGGPRRDG